MLKEWVGETSVLGFGILLLPPERLRVQKTWLVDSIMTALGFLIGREVKTQILAKTAAMGCGERSV